MKRLFILIAALILAVNSAYALPRNVALRNSGNQAGYERLVRGLEPTLWLATDEGITVSGSNVTQWDSKIGSISFTQGTVANQPLLSTSGVENLLTYSEEILAGTGIYSTFRATSTDGQSDPTGGTDAQLVTEDGTSGTHGIQATPITVVSGTRYRASIYVKDNGRDFRLTSSAMEGASLTVDTSDGSILASSGADEYFVESIGSGWYRVGWVFTSTASSSSAYLYYQLTDGTTTSYTGDSSSGAYVFGGQFHRADTPLAYVATTNAPIHGSLTGRKGVVFDGSDDVMTTTSTWDDLFDNDTKEIIIVVSDLVSDTDSAGGYNNDPIIADESAYYVVGAVRSSGVIYHYNYPGSSTYTSTSDPDLLSTKVITGQHYGGNLYTQITGLIDQSATSGSTSTFGVSPRLGNRSTYYLGMHLYEIITFDKVLSDSQRQAIIEGLEGKYRID